jgi:hypothetical protein
MLYQCFIRGENFPGTLIGDMEPVGFFTTRWVEASSPEEAEKLALELLRDDPIFQSVEPELGKTSGAKVYFEEIFPAEHKGVNSGATWFPMDKRD